MSGQKSKERGTGRRKKTGCEEKEEEGIAEVEKKQEKYSVKSMRENEGEMSP